MVDDKHIAHIQLLGDNKLNDLLGALIPHIEINAVNELIPDMDQIFIEAVQNFNAAHE